MALFHGLIRAFLASLTTFWVLLVGVKNVILFRTPRNKRLSVFTGGDSHAPASGETRPLRHVSAQRGLVETRYHDCTTLYETFRHGWRCNPRAPCLGTRVVSTGHVREYAWLSYNRVHERLTNFGSGLVSLGLERGARLGIYAKNSALWVIAELACYAYGFVPVALYDTLGVENRGYIIQQAELSIIVAENHLVPNILELLPKCPCIRHVITMDEPKGAELDGEDRSIGLSSFVHVESMGETRPSDHCPPLPDDVAMIMYTSGTSSQPKGVIMTHRNIVSVVSAAAMGAFGSLSSSDTHLSYMPLAHILERVTQQTVFVNGGRVGFYQGDIRNLDKDIAELRPTVFVGVPRVFSRTMNIIRRKLQKSSFIHRLIFILAYRIKARAVVYRIPTMALDRLVFHSTKRALGGRVRRILSGGAPLGGKCHEFIRVCMGCPVLQGYGLTETCGGACVTPYRAPLPYENCGPPLSCCEIKLVSTGSYSVTNTPPQGEIHISGPLVAQGYLGLPELTRETFLVDEYGKRWCATGDVGEFNRDGTVSIIGRTKSIFKLDTGEYVAPTRLESIYVRSHFVDSLFVYGDSKRSLLVAIVVVDMEAAQRWASGHFFPLDSSSEESVLRLCANEAFNADVLGALALEAKQAHLTKRERVAAVHLTPYQWTPSTGLVTESLKNIRNALTEAYASEIAQLYTQIERPPVEISAGYIK